MSSSAALNLRSRFNPAFFRQPARAPIERVERSADLLGAPPARSVVFKTAASAALSGPDAAETDLAPPVDLYAPGARFDARA
jgi:hypothetical protein